MGWSPFRPVGLTHHKSSASFKGYTLITPIGGDSTFLLDMQGRVVHQWQLSDERSDYAILLPTGNLLLKGAPKDARLTQAEMTDPEMTIEERAKALPSHGYFLKEINWDAEEVWRHDDAVLHHDFKKTKDGTYLYTRFCYASDEVSEKLRGKRSHRKHANPIVTDQFVEVDAEGKEIWSVNLEDVLDPKLDGLDVLERDFEWTHTNAIDQNADGTKIVFSAKNNSRVCIIDKQSGELTWRWGRPETSGQHHASFLPNGNVLVFDNGVRKPGLPFSRVVEVNPDDSETAWQYVANPPFSFWATNISSAERQPNGNTLICEGTSGRIFEVTRSGEVVWEWQSPFVNAIRPGQNLHFIFRAHRYGPDFSGLGDRDLDPSRYKALNQMHGLTE